ncbi:MAG: universal stress protein [Cellulomonas sp.]|nr:universal stress protein [Cellulomonas sp.]
MNVLVWINESTWPSCVAAARELAPAGASLTLLHVVDDAVPAAARGAFAGRDVRVEQRSGRVEREVVAAAEGMNLLVVARDGDLRRLGPHPLAPATRFVVDHAPCATLLVWPAAAPGVESIPPPPLHPPH